MKGLKISPWQVIDTEVCYSAQPWIKLSKQKVLLPSGQEVANYHKIDLVDYAGVVAQTLDGKFIFERMYKHGVGKVCLTLPGGGINANETPLEAVQRELLEETGYVAEDWQSLGSFVCDGNYGCGHAHLFFANNARRVAAPRTDDLEEMEIGLLSIDEVRESLRQGSFAVLGAAAGVALAFNAGLIISSKNIPSRKV